MRRVLVGTIAALLVAASPARAAKIDLGPGAWSWFGDPRAVTYQGVTYAGWVDGEGDIVVASYHHASGQRLSTVLHRALQRDDHVNPSLLVRPDGHITAFYSKHGGGAMLYRTTRARGDISTWLPEQRLPTNTTGDPYMGYTYPNPMRLADEAATYLFWRGGDWEPAFSIQGDRSMTWSPARRLLVEPGRRPYVKYASNGEDTIHFAFTNGHPSSTPDTNIYYARYRNGVIERADGTDVGTLAAPIVKEDADKVFDGPEDAWAYDAAIDAQGNPVIVFASFPSLTDHRYHYARWNGTTWDVHQITPAGGSFATENRNRYYSGGIALDHEDPSRVYLSRQVGSAWEVELWTTADGGTTWISRPVTSGSEVKNVRPVSPWGRDPSGSDVGVLWMRGGYDHFVSYSTSIGALVSQPPTLHPPSPETSSGAPAARAAKRSVHLRLRRRIVRIDRRGHGVLWVTCLAEPGDACRVSGQLLSAHLAKARGRVRGRALGRIVGRVPGGRSGNVALRLTREGRRRLFRSGRLRLPASIIWHSEGSTLRSARAKLVLVRR